MNAGPAPLAAVTSVVLARFIASPVGRRLAEVARTIGESEEPTSWEHLSPPPSPAPPPGALLASVEQVAAAVQMPMKWVYPLVAHWEMRGVCRFGRTVRIDLNEAVKGTSRERVERSLMRQRSDIGARQRRRRCPAINCSYACRTRDSAPKPAP
jgi:hypothetical protein